MHRARLAQTAIVVSVAVSGVVIAGERFGGFDDPVAVAHPHIESRIVQELATLRANRDVAPEWPEGWPYSDMFNRESPVPPQCYTRTEGIHNPCYVCHQVHVEGRENWQNDFELQQEYAFSDVGFTNQWANLFEDRSERASAMSDAQILDYVRTDNYSELAGRLEDAGFEGYIPDLDGLQDGRAAFDDEGFARDGSGWVAFNYKPLPSTFWPTNGAADDVMIRLPEAYRQTAYGTASRDVYRANLALLELGIKDVERMSCRPVDETIVGTDLDGDGSLGIAHHVVRRTHFVGAADDRLVLDTMYPKGTEFLHSVRYLDVLDDGSVVGSRRMKELRYMYRAREMRRSWTLDLYRGEREDKEEQGKLPRHQLDRERRLLESETGWQVAGFVEAADGRLRTNTFEETMFCMGCHNSVGATTDKTFSFVRKVDGADGWQYIDLKGMPDAPSYGEPHGEILTYLDRVGGGSEFRNNDEMFERWFHADGTVNVEKVEAAEDVYELITPSARRALDLNKAYRVIVLDQDFIFGRDAVLAPPANVYDVVDPETAPILPPDRRFVWDMRLDWAGTHAAAHAAPAAPVAEAAAEAESSSD